jgi:hypothetical protein
MARAAFGFRAHSGWAAMVVIAGNIRSPIVVRGSRVELANPGIPRPVQPYHAAQEMKLNEAEAYIAGFAQVAENLATQAVRVVLGELREEGYLAVGCGIASSSGRPIPTVEAALASHPLLHTAEGELFRGAITRAAKRWRLPVYAVREKTALSIGVEKLGFNLVTLQSHLRDLGRSIGPPWGQDQKIASLVAWLALTDQAKT